MPFEEMEREMGNRFVRELEQGFSYNEFLRDEVLSYPQDGFAKFLVTVIDFGEWEADADESRGR